MKYFPQFGSLSFALFFIVSTLANADEPLLSKGQALYLPIYSHLWHGDLKDRGHPLKNPFSALVSIRNTDMKHPIRVLSARYFDTSGKQLNDYISTAKTIPPMGTYELYVERKESAGGSGANFVILWDAATPTNLPMIEAVHADIQGNHTLSFVTSARPIRTDN